MSVRLLTPEDLAELLGVPVKTLYAWRHKSEGPPAYRIGRHLRFDAGDVNAWLGDTA
jgi:excisionase family DNA binding protein